MKTSRKELKLRARRALLGRYPAAVGIMIMTGIIGVIFGVVMELWVFFSAGISTGAMGADTGIFVMLFALFLGLTVFLLIFGMLIPGHARFYLNLCQGRRAGFGDMFWGLTEHGGKFFGIGLLLALIAAFLMAPQFVLLGAAFVTGEVEFPLLFLLFYNLLLTVLSVYAGLTYNLFYLILSEEPEQSVWEALRESRRLMRGNRLRMFVLSVSFLGWVLAAYITMGLGLLWLIPYISCTYCCFYLDLREKYRA